MGGETAKKKQLGNGKKLRRLRTVWFVSKKKVEEKTRQSMGQRRKKK